MDTTINENSGSFDEIILPLYRAVKQFYSQSFTKAYWNQLDSKRIKDWTDLINIKK